MEDGEKLGLVCGNNSNPGADLRCEIVALVLECPKVCVGVGKMEVDILKWRAWNRERTVLGEKKVTMELFGVLTSEDGYGFCFARFEVDGESVAGKVFMNGGCVAL